MDDAKRKEVVKEALTWLRTPYHHQGDLKGIGVDCAQLLIRVYHKCGLIPDLHIKDYPQDWHLHRDTERYLGWVEKFAKKIEYTRPLPGDVVLFQFGRCISHGAIIIEWPTMIHASLGEGVLFVDIDKHPQITTKRLRGVYTL